VTCAISATARSKASLFFSAGLVMPLTFRTYCSAAACTSSEVAWGSKLYRGRILRHMPVRWHSPRPWTRVDGPVVDRAGGVEPKPVETAGELNPDIHRLGAAYAPLVPIALVSTDEFSSTGKVDH
jgi:hypothetical protein